MSLDRSLKAGSSLAGHRNVLNRMERIVRMTEKGQFTSGSTDPLHLPKVGNRKIAAGGKVKKDAEADAAAPAAGAAAPAAAAAKPAAGGKAAAAPAAKAAAPAAKKK